MEKRKYWKQKPADPKRPARASPRLAWQLDVLLQVLRSGVTPPQCDWFVFQVDLVMLLSISLCPSATRSSSYPGAGQAGWPLGGAQDLDAAPVSARPAGRGAYAEPAGAGTGAGLRCRWDQCLQGTRKRQGYWAPDSWSESRPAHETSLSLATSRGLFQGPAWSDSGVSSLKWAVLEGRPSPSPRFC